MIILIRHARTDGNATRYVGREDPPVNANGCRELAALALALVDVPIDAVFSSPLRRAVTTGDAIAVGRTIALDVRPELVELDFGELAGLPKAAARRSLRRHHLDDPVPGGESLRDVWERVDPVAGELLERSTSESIAVVGHYWSLRVLRCRLMGVELREGLRGDPYRPPTASAYALDVRAGAVRQGVWLHAAKLASA